MKSDWLDQSEIWLTAATQSHENDWLQLEAIWLAAAAPVSTFMQLRARTACVRDNTWPENEDSGCFPGEFSFRAV